ncbi:hypothetical protein [Altericroceibacterium endophyticum]|uniref:Lipoprotein n=1 Tax=Altericroceibacterium endophyticum TaxID=1808508 RepID=A0A6I4T709_9SPHN|nr:hypothetical protein [Altericroceibacterium endophyticum]MXO65891.1 hypothetical protein [Altericroceibacterium endophyticum]
MRRGLAIILSGLVLSACASGPSGHRGAGGIAFRPAANPTGVLTADLAFARAYQTDGLDHARRDYAFENTVFLGPDDRNGLPAMTGWRPYNVWSSCDGSLAATYGAYEQSARNFGDYVTIWRRAEKGEYRAVVRLARQLPAPAKRPEFAQAKTAQCGADHLFHDARSDRPDFSAIDPTAPSGAAFDDTLTYRWAADDDSFIRVSMMRDGEMQPIIDFHSPMREKGER